MNLNDLLVLQSVAQKGSFSAAAKALSMPVSTVSRRVVALEKALSIQLLQRSTRSVILTEAGQILLNKATPHLSALQNSFEFLQQKEETLTGRMVVVSPIFLSYFRLSCWLGEFQALHPELEIVYRISNQMEDIVADKVDLAIRPGPLKDSNLIAKKLYDTQMAVFASKKWQARFGEVTRPEQLNDVDSITLNYFANEWRLDNGTNSVIVYPNSRIYSNDFGPLSEAMCHGEHIGVLPQVFGNELVAKGRLVKVLPDYRVQSPGPIYAVYASKQFMSLKTRELLKFLQEKFASL